MFTLTRISTEPASPLKIQVSQPADGDAGLTQGGSFVFEPAGTEGSVAGMSEHAARVILGDPGMAPHFRCDPPLPGTTAAPVAEAEPSPVPPPPPPASQDPGISIREGGPSRRR
jgi:hypothetical protein